MADLVFTMRWQLPKYFGSIELDWPGDLDTVLQKSPSSILAKSSDPFQSGELLPKSQVFQQQVAAKTKESSGKEKIEP
jgi:hypothetical protein